MAANVLSALTPSALDALASLRDAIVENIAIGAKKFLGGLFEGIQFAGNAITGSSVEPTSVATSVAHNRGSPGTGIG